MQTVLLERITVPPNRQRRNIAPAEVASLAESIRTKGLLHPPVVRLLDDDTYQLVAGERRLRAIESLKGQAFDCNGQTVNGLGGGPIVCPVTFISDLDPIMLREAELEENILRVDLTWNERAEAFAELHKLRTEQNPDQTLTATAKEIVHAEGGSLNAAQVEVSRARLVAQHLHNPKVAGARNLKEAYNIVSRELEAEVKLDLSRALKATTEHQLIIADATQALNESSSGLYDVILVDPPYGMDADSFGTAGAAHTYDDSVDVSLELCCTIIARGYAITKAQAHLYMFCDFDNFVFLRETCEMAGWKAFRTPIIWHKTDSKGHDPWPNRGFRRTYETILYAIKGDKTCSQLVNDVIAVPSSGHELHAAAKPVELYERLLRRSCIPGDMVIDPCCGTGTIFAAANRLTLRAIGIERDETFAKVAEARMYEKE